MLASSDLQQTQEHETQQLTGYNRYEHTCNIISTSVLPHYYYYYYYYYYYHYNYHYYCCYYYYYYYYYYTHVHVYITGTKY